MSASRAQMMVGLQDVMPAIFAGKSPITEAANFYDWMQEDPSWGEVDLADVLFRLDRHFGTNIPQEEWEQFLGVRPEYDDEWHRAVKPRLTFGRLADLIALRTEPVSFAPAVVGFQECAPAGAFLAMRRLYEQVGSVVDDRRFAPSTAIFGFLQGRDLAAYWSQLRWQSSGRVPALRYPHERIGGLLMCLGFVFGMLGLIGGLALSIPVLILSALLMGSLLCGLGNELQWAGNPLPADIVTFRDAAEQIAGSGPPAA